MDAIEYRSNIPNVQQVLYKVDCKNLKIGLEFEKHLVQSFLN